LQPKDRAEILCVYEKDEGFLEFLQGLELFPGAKLEILRREYDETMTVRVAGRTTHLGKPATSRIWVRSLIASEARKRSGALANSAKSV
jgi:FeoA domain